MRRRYPDGSEIVFLRDDGSDTWIAAKDVGSGAERVAVDTDPIELDPSVGPDGSIWYSSGDRPDRSSSRRRSSFARGFGSWTGATPWRHRCAGEHSKGGDPPS